MILIQVRFKGDLKTLGSCKAHMSPPKKICLGGDIIRPELSIAGELKMTCILSHQSHAAITTLAFCNPRDFWVTLRSKASGFSWLCPWNQLAPRREAIFTSKKPNAQLNQSMLLNKFLLKIWNFNNFNVRVWVFVQRPGGSFLSWTKRKPLFLKLRV